MWSCCIWCFGRFVNISATSHRTQKRFAASDSTRKFASFKPKIVKFHPQLPILHFPLLLLPSTLCHISVNTSRTDMQIVFPDSCCKSLSNEPPTIKFRPQFTIWQVPTALPVHHLISLQPDIARLSFLVYRLVHTSGWCV